MVFYFEMKMVQLSIMSMYMHTEGGSDAVWDQWSWGKWHREIGWIYTYISANVLPPTSPSHNPCFSETLVPVLTKETRCYSETPVPISQKTGRQVLEDKSGLVSGIVLNLAWSKVCGALCCSKTAILGEVALRGTGANEVRVYMQLYRLYRVGQNNLPTF